MKKRFFLIYDINIRWSKAKQSHYTPWRRLEGEEVKLLLVLDLGTR
jgi:hypothetical protein